MHETAQFPMPILISMGPKRMLEHAKSKGLVVPLEGYRIYVYGASTKRLTPQAWTTVQQFWAMYFSAAGAELVSYSPECSVPR